MNILAKLKKALAPLLAAVMMTGCLSGRLPQNPPSPKLCGGFTCDIEAAAIIIPPEKEKEEEFSFSGHLKRLGAGFYELEITAPETVAGLKISACDDTLVWSMGELTFDADAEKMPSRSPVRQLFVTLDSAAARLSSDGKLTATKTEETGAWYFSGEGYAVSFDGSGTPTEINISTHRLTVRITNFAETAPTLGTSR